MGRLVRPTVEYTFKKKCSFYFSKVRKNVLVVKFRSDKALALLFKLITVAKLKNNIKE